MRQRVRLARIEAVQDVGAAAEGAGTITVTLKDLTLAADKATAKAGSVSFKADNKGSLVHELVDRKSVV